MSIKTYWRRLGMAMATASGLASRGYFLPYRYAKSAGRRVRSGYPALEPLFAGAVTQFRSVIAELDALADPLLGFNGPPPEPRWRQDWFPGLDGAVMYTMVRNRRPVRVVEIGSGHSTRFMVRAMRDAAYDGELTAIDPAPRADISALPITCVREPLQRAGSELFTALEAGDLLSIDSSHLAVAGSDVDILINQILPSLPAGVLVHIHDIFLPDPYPVNWAWREYNEQSVVAPLVHGGGYELLWASHYVRTRMTDGLAGAATGRLFVPEGATESSLWIRKC